MTHSLRTRRPTISLCIAVMLLAPGAITAQSTGSASPYPVPTAQPVYPPTQVRWPPMIVPFDTAVTRVSSAMLTTITAIVDSLKRIPPKGEYETSASFRDRAMSAFSGYVAVEMPVNRSLSLCAPFTHYSADSSAWTLIGPYDSSPRQVDFVGETGPFDLLNADVATVKCNSQNTGSYEASNAFGATVTVREAESTTWGFVFFGSSLDEAPITLRIAPDEAASVVPYLRYLVVAEPMSVGAAGWLHIARYLRLPTIDAPSRVVDNYNLIAAKHVAIWVYDGRTGAVYGKFDAHARPSPQ